MTAARAKLPERRECTTISVRWPEETGPRYHISLGHYNGRIGEAWVHGPKAGSDMSAVLDDACILFSILLQTGYPPDRLAASLGRVTDGGARTSPLGLVADQIAGVYK